MFVCVYLCGCIHNSKTISNGDRSTKSGCKANQCQEGGPTFTLNLKNKSMYTYKIFA